MRWRIKVLAALGLLVACQEEGPPQDWIARLELVKGKVLTISDDPPQKLQAKKGDHLRVGSQLETGKKSWARLVLRNGGELTVEPDSLVLLGADTSARTRTEVSLTRGSVVGTGSRMEASELVIAVGDRKVRLAAESRATVVAPRAGEVDPGVVVSYGKAEVESPSGKSQTVVAGETLTLILQRPDAAVPPKPAAPDAGPVTASAPELVFHLTIIGRGKVLVQRPSDTRPIRVRRGEVVDLVSGTRITLLAGARVVVGRDEGDQTEVVGPAQLVARLQPGRAEGEPPTIRLHTERGELSIARRGRPGRAGSGFDVEGVHIEPRITYRRVDIRVKREREGSLVDVQAGAAQLTGRGGSLLLEAGQRALLSRGAIAGPQEPAPSPLKISEPGTLRLFTPMPKVPVTLRWAADRGGAGILVEASRRRGLDHPIFADVIRRAELTLPAVRRGGLYWRIRPVGADGRPGPGGRGKVLLLRDTSFRRLAGNRPPYNTIHESYGNTKVYYQNKLPRFTFNWDPMPGAQVYQIKIFREQSLGSPLLTEESRATHIALASGRLGEGSYIWYVAGRGADGSLVRTTSSRTLSVLYDNATPDVQIIHPRNGLRVSGATLLVRGVTLPDSTVLINGATAALDESFRFSHPVSLGPGRNVILINVSHPRTGSSYYLRSVVRR